MRCQCLLLLLNCLSSAQLYPHAYYTNAYLRSTNPIGDVHVMDAYLNTEFSIPLPAEDATPAEYEQRIYAEIQKSFQNWIKYLKRQSNTLYKGIVHLIRPTAHGHSNINGSNNPNNNNNHNYVFWVPMGNVSFSFAVAFDTSGTFSFSKN